MVTTQKVLRGQIYLAKLTGKGCEQRGKRPVLILQNDVGNKYSPTTIVAPITSSTKKKFLPVHVPIESNRLYKNSMVLCEQVQVIDKSRLGKLLCRISDKTLIEVDKAKPDCRRLRLDSSKAEWLASRLRYSTPRRKIVGNQP